MSENTNTAVQATPERKALVIAKEATTWLQSEASNNLLTVPEGYDLGSEMSLAMMKIAQTVDRNQRNALSVCTKESILTALKNMAINGLSMSRNQCYPIVYGNALQIQRSYFGTIASLERMFPEYKITANVIYQGDEYDYVYNEDTSCYEIKNLKSSLKNKNNPIEGAFGFIKDRTTGRSVHSECMTMEEISKAWSHAKTDKVQKEFPQEMAKRTLINRMCKTFVNKNKNVSAEYLSAYNAMTEAEYDNNREAEPVNPVKEKAIREKSRGNEGLKAILSSDSFDDVSPSPVETAPVVEEPVRADENGNGEFNLG